MTLPRTAFATLLATLTLAAAACSHADIGDEELAPEPRAAQSDAAPSAVSDVEAVYMLKQYAPDQYAVDLSGGMSEVRSGPSFLGRSEPEKKATVRTVTGRIVDASGAPVAGAVVVAGGRLSAILGESLTAGHGTTTDGEGRYALPLTTDEPVALLALANETAWSALQEIAGGTDDIELEVGLAQPGHLTGRLQRAGQPAQPVVVVRDRDERPRFMLRIQGEADGSYESPPLPPGEYVVGYAVDDGKILAARYVEEHRMFLRAGQPVVQDVSFAGGTKLTLGYEGLEDDPLRTVTYTVLAGQHAPQDPEALDALKEGGQAEVLTRILVGGIDLRPPREFPDMPAGEVTVCLEARGMKNPDELAKPDLMMAFECRTIELGPEDVAREVTFSL